MLGESWLNEELGSENSPNPLRDGETASIVSVVNGFIRNDMGLSREDVSRYADQALLNEAHDILRSRSYADEVAYSWTGQIEQARAVGNVQGEEYAQRRFDELHDTMTEEYNTGRTSLAEAVQQARQSGRVLLSQDTCRAVVSMDHDGYMSEAMGVDVPKLFGDNPLYDSQAASRAADAVRAVDFSRVPRPEKQQPAQDSKTRAAALERVRGARQTQGQADASREPVRASQAVNELMERLRSDERPAASAPGPELG